MKNSYPVVAIVDDEEAVRKALGRLLRASGMASETFASGQEFLDSLAAQRPDCLVLDLQMPVLNGLDVLHELAKGGQRVPTIVITAHDEAQSQAQCRSAGAAAYLCKPLDGKVLLDTIASVVRGPH
jgi:FixJ family two-component response regulator